MKKLECVVRPEKVRELAEKLILAGAMGMTVTEIKGFGRQTTRPGNYLFLPKSKIEMYVSDSQVEEFIKVIADCCREEELGSGKIVVLPIEEAVRVRTMERAEAALI